MSSVNRKPIPKTRSNFLAAKRRISPSRALPSPGSLYSASTESSFFAFSRPRFAASLKLLSPSPPTSKTSPTFFLSPARATPRLVARATAMSLRMITSPRGPLYQDGPRERMIQNLTNRAQNQRAFFHFRARVMIRSSRISQRVSTISRSMSKTGFLIAVSFHPSRRTAGGLIFSSIQEHASRGSKETPPDHPERGDASRASEASSTRDDESKGVLLSLYA